MGHLRPSRDQSGEVYLRVDSGVILGQSEVNLGPLSEKPHENQLIYLCLAVGRALRLEYD